MFTTRHLEMSCVVLLTKIPKSLVFKLFYNCWYCSKWLRFRLPKDFLSVSLQTSSSPAKWNHFIKILYHFSILEYIVIIIYLRFSYFHVKVPRKHFYNLTIGSIVLNTLTYFSLSFDYCWRKDKLNISSLHKHFVIIMVVSLFLLKLT